MKAAISAGLILSSSLLAAPLPRFPAGAVWNQNIEAAPLHPDSELMINTLDGLGGFGGADFRRMQIDFPLEGYNPAARVILNTFKRYGIVLADGGNIALTAESDLYTDTGWEELGVNSRLFDLTPGGRDVDITDFEVIDTGPRIAETWDCVRTAVPMSFVNGFEE